MRSRLEVIRSDQHEANHTRTNRDRMQCKFRLNHTKKFFFLISELNPFKCDITIKDAFHHISAQFKMMSRDKQNALRPKYHQERLMCLMFRLCKNSQFPLRCDGYEHAMPLVLVLFNTTSNAVQLCQNYSLTLTVCTMLIMLYRVV